MFFRREKLRELSLSDRLESLRQAGFTVQNETGGKVRSTRGRIAAILEDRGPEPPAIGKSGVVIGNEIGFLVNGGYQQFFVTPAGRKLAALAEHLRALHDFDEDMREALGITSLYNTSLGTTSSQHMYDRVNGRERRVTPRKA